MCLVHAQASVNEGLRHAYTLEATETPDTVKVRVDFNVNKATFALLRHNHPHPTNHPQQPHRHRRSKSRRKSLALTTGGKENAPIPPLKQIALVEWGGGLSFVRSDDPQTYIYIYIFIFTPIIILKKPPGYVLSVTRVDMV